jgi:hypothetical protein
MVAWILDALWLVKTVFDAGWRPKICSAKSWSVSIVAVKVKLAI